MTVTIQHEKFGQIQYSENWFTGARTISVGGYQLTKKDKTTYYIPGGDPNAVVYVKGNTLSGTTLTIMGQEIQVTPKTTWYEYAMAISIFAIVLVWGFVPALLEIIPIVGGALGGAASGLMLCVCITFMKKTNNILIKVLIWLGSLVGTFALCYLLYVLLVGLIVSIA